LQSVRGKGEQEGEEFISLGHVSSYQGVRKIGLGNDVSRGPERQKGKKGFRGNVLFESRGTKAGSFFEIREKMPAGVRVRLRKRALTSHSLLKQKKNPQKKETKKKLSSARREKGPFRSRGTVRPGQRRKDA